MNRLGDRFNRRLDRIVRPDIRLCRHSRSAFELRQGGTLTYARGGDLALPARPSPQGLGGSIARAVEEGLRQ